MRMPVCKSTSESGALSSRRRVDGVEVDTTIQHERAVKFDFHTGVAFLIFFVGFAITGVGGCANARQLSKAMSTDVPAAIRVEINQ